MSQQTPRAEITLKSVVYGIPGMEDVTVARDIPYGATAGETLVYDLYRAADGRVGVARPAVVFVHGYPDRGVRAILGCATKEMESYISWARLVAASGMVGVTYTSTQPVEDARAILNHLCAHAQSLGIDAGRMAIWSCSGNVPNALTLLMRDGHAAVRCGALLYGYMLDLGEATGVADAAAQFRFVNPTQGRSVNELRADVPMCIVRAGQDQMPGLNFAMDAFAAESLRLNLPLTLLNCPDEPHAFDILHAAECSRAAICQVLDFLRVQLARELPPHIY